MHQPLVLAPHDPQLIFQHPPSLDDIRCTRAEDLLIEEAFFFLLPLLFLLFLFGVCVLHLCIAVGVLFAIAIAILVVSLLVSLLTLKVVEIFKGGHGGRWRELGTRCVVCDG